jgi:periplasmic protein TonB
VTLGSAVAGSIVLHLVVIAVAVLGFGRQVPAAEVPASITVFIPPAPPAAPVAEAKPAEPPPLDPAPEPVPDYTLPPPEESLAVPDFKAPPPPPPKEPPPKAAAAPPKPAPPRPPVVAAPQPAPSAPPATFQPAAPVANSAPPSAPSIVPGWNVQLASWLASHKRYPSAARQRSEEGEVLVSFTVESDGHVSAVSIAKSSGHPDLDQATLAMLQGATLPAPGTAATRTVRVHYRLDD